MIRTNGYYINYVNLQLISDDDPVLTEIENRVIKL